MLLAVRIKTTIMKKLDGTCYLDFTLQDAFRGANSGANSEKEKRKTSIYQIVGGGDESGLCTNNLPNRGRCRLGFSAGYFLAAPFFSSRFRVRSIALSPTATQKPATSSTSSSSDTSSCPSSQPITISMVPPISRAEPTLAIA